MKVGLGSYGVGPSGPGVVAVNYTFYESRIGVLWVGPNGQGVTTVNYTFYESGVGVLWYGSKWTKTCGSYSFLGSSVGFYWVQFDMGWADLNLSKEGEVKLGLIQIHLLKHVFVYLFVYNFCNERCLMNCYLLYVQGVTQGGPVPRLALSQHHGAPVSVMPPLSSSRLPRVSLPVLE